MLRFNGAQAVTQILPKISGEPQAVDEPRFTIGPFNTPLYTGGQEVIVAEVMGGHRLTIRAATGDTIDGFTGSVRIGPRSARTLVSDGDRNWITTSFRRFPSITFPITPNPGEPVDF